MALDNDIKTRVMKEAGPIIAGSMASFVVGAVAEVIIELITTNHKESDLVGDKEMHPTKDEMAASKVNTGAKDTDANLAKDTLAAKDGDLSAAKTDAKAMEGEAKAADSGASALRTKAGASDIETKALKMT
ncbi:hypothetical protein FACS1894190_03920 [Spirochaetia bacterium]|nr:hypothetical protein FACS1894190_03920 [Spirochaetia bacterium]